jgi:hypothetical protein
MTRLSLYAVLAAFAAGPWGGCERDPVTPEPVTPPATPPAERARAAVGEARAGFDGAVLLDDSRRRG